MQRLTRVSGKPRLALLSGYDKVTQVNSGVTHIRRARENGEALPLHVVLVYEDFQMGVQGKACADMFARELEAAEDVRLTVWKYEFFQSPELANAATQHAEQADIVIVAARNWERMPGTVQAWLEDWPPRRKIGPGALVATFPPGVGPKPRTTNVGLLLLRAAGRGNMDFFCFNPTPPAATPNIPASAESLSPQGGSPA